MEGGVVEEEGLTNFFYCVKGGQIFRVRKGGISFFTTVKKGKWHARFIVQQKCANDDNVCHGHQQGPKS